MVYRGPRRQCKVKGDWWGWSRRDLSDVAKGGGGAKSEGWQIKVRRLPDASASPRYVVKKRLALKARQDRDLGNASRRYEQVAEHPSV